MSTIERYAIVGFLIAWCIGAFYGGPIGTTIGVLVGIPCWIVAWIERRRSNRRKETAENLAREESRKQHFPIFDEPPPQELNAKIDSLVDLYDYRTCSYLCRVQVSILLPLLSVAHKESWGSNDIAIIYEMLEPPFMEKPNPLQTTLEPHFDRLVHITLRWIPVAQGGKTQCVAD